MEVASAGNWGINPLEVQSCIQDAYLKEEGCGSHGLYGSHVVP